MDNRAFQVVDAHVNVASTHFIPRRFIEDQASNMYCRLSAMGEKVSKSRILDMMLAQYQDHNADQLVREMDLAGVARAILLVPDFTWSGVRIETNPTEMAERHAAIMKRHPNRFHVFMGVDPRRGKEGVDSFERAITDYGFQGMKLYPPCGYSPSDSRLDPYYEICDTKKIPVLCHTGPGWQALDFKYGHPLLVDDAARRFLGVSFILAHGGVTYREEAASLCMYRENVYLDVSGFMMGTNPEGWKVHLNEAFRFGINHKVLFGSSWPAFRMSASLKNVISEVVGGPVVFKDVKNVDKHLILSGNIDRLLALAATKPNESHRPAEVH